MEWESYLSLRQKELSWFQMHQVAGDVQLYGEPNGGNGGNGIGMQSRVMAYCPKELLPVLLLCIVWGKEGPGKLIRCHCDNMPVVEILTGSFHNSGYSRDREMMPLLRCLIFL